MKTRYILGLGFICLVLIGAVFVGRAQGAGAEPTVKKETIGESETRSSLSLTAEQQGAYDAFRTRQKERGRSASTSAAGEEINWQVLSGGRTNGASTSYQMMGTVGQTAVGPGASTNHNINHGYWQSFSGGSGGCCNGDGLRGNVDLMSGPGGEIDVADLTYLVEFLFKGGPAPLCEDEGNVDGLEGPGGPIDVADLTYLVDYLFKGGPEPPACP